MKLNTTIKESQTRSEQIEVLEGSLRNEQEKMTQLQAEKSAQVATMTSQIAAIQAESSSKILQLESNMTELQSHKEQADLRVTQQLQRVSELESNASSLQNLVTQSELKVQECARLEVERQLLEKKVVVHQEETAKMTEKLSQTKIKKTQKKNEVAEIR